MKNHSKIFHLLFIPGTCRQATVWSRCIHCVRTSFLKPGIELRLSDRELYGNSFNLFWRKYLMGILKTCQFFYKNSMLNTSNIFWGLQKGILFVGQRTACVCNNDVAHGPCEAACQRAGTDHRGRQRPARVTDPQTTLTTEPWAVLPAQEPLPPSKHQVSGDKLLLVKSTGFICISP